MLCRHIFLIKTLTHYWTLQVWKPPTGIDYSLAYSCLQSGNNYVIFDYFNDLFLSFPFERMNYGEENLIFHLKVKNTSFRLKFIFNKVKEPSFITDTMTSRFLKNLCQLTTVNCFCNLDFVSIVPLKC